MAFFRALAQQTFGFQNVFTQADRTAVEAAMVQFAVDGFAMVQVGTQVVTARTMSDLETLLNLVDKDLQKSVAATNRPGLGIRAQQWKPYYP